MRDAVNTVLALACAAVFILLVRALAVTVYAIPDNLLAPHLVAGDRVLVNRWSYGLRTGGDSIFRYTRWMKSPVKKGDFIAFNSPADSTHRISARPVLMGRVVAVPGDTITAYGKRFVIPDRYQICTCRPVASHYLVGTDSASHRLLVHEQHIIGRAFLILYNFQNMRFHRQRWLKTLP